MKSCLVKAEVGTLILGNDFLAKRFGNTEPPVRVLNGKSSFSVETIAGVLRGHMSSLEMKQPLLT